MARSPRARVVTRLTPHLLALSAVLVTGLARAQNEDDLELPSQAAPTAKPAPPQPVPAQSQPAAQSTATPATTPESETAKPAPSQSDAAGAATAPTTSPSTTGASPAETSAAQPTDAGVSATRNAEASTPSVVASATEPLAPHGDAARTNGDAESSRASVNEPAPPAAVPQQGTCSDLDQQAWVFGSASKRDGFVANPYSKGLGCGHQISGFVQGQLQFNQISEDQLQASGAPLNRDQFVLRATRVRLDAGYSYAGYSFELDANTVRGARVGIRRAEGLLFYRNAQPGSAPLLALSIGVSDIPFGYELVESTSARWFVERSVASEALFPTQTDINARLFGAWRFLRYALALGNGQPVNDSSYSSDPNAPKELVARFGADAAFAKSFAVSGGTSFSFGKGFHPGSPATKDGVAWRDDNSDGVATPNEIIGVPGSAATASENFERWVLGVDLQLQLRTAIGLSVLAVEGYLGSNHDRGLFANDPVETGRDLRQSGLVLSFTQQVLERGIVGFRFSSYDPDSDFAEGRRGNFVPRSQGVTTLSPLLGLAWPDPARLILQYDWVNDEFARDSIGVPTDAKNNQLTARLQVAL